MSMLPKVAGALKNVLGREVTCLHQARQHGRAIDALLETEISPDFRQHLEERKQAVKSKWGGWDPSDLKVLKISPVALGDWLGKRREPERDFYMLKEAAIQLLNGNDQLLNIMIEALSKAEKGPVRTETFRLWIIRTGVAEHVAGRQYAAGPHAKALSTMEWDDVARQIQEHET